jgi:hypothetical protein
MKIQRRVITNRVFLLGLDEIYREAMKRHERVELLRCARETASALRIAPADVPIEGYYAEDAELTEYFRLVRALQTVPEDRKAQVCQLEGFNRLRRVTESSIFGSPCCGGYLLPAGKDALSVALERSFPLWTVDNLTKLAFECAAESSDFSLVALAALSKDPVTIAALRESVVLYAAVAVGCAGFREPEYEYVWQVDDIIQDRALRFVDCFNALFAEHLPRPGVEHAKEYWEASDEWKIIGRCVRIGFDDSVIPVRHYHWAIDRDNRYKPIVTEFWDNELWTTARYREEQDAGKRQR